jgi:hypothetical protein
MNCKSPIVIFEFFCLLLRADDLLSNVFSDSDYVRILFLCILTLTSAIKSESVLTCILSVIVIDLSIN